MVVLLFNYQPGKESPVSWYIAVLGDTADSMCRKKV